MGFHLQGSLARIVRHDFCTHTASVPRMSGQRKIVFIKSGRWSHSNEATRTVLTREFSDHQLIIVDVDIELLGRRLVNLMNWCHVWWHYGRDLTTRRRTFRECVYRTPWIYCTIRRWIKGRIQEHLSDLDFTLQTQSLYDASSDGVPHFVFTDHTHLANLDYPDFDPSLLFPHDWMDLERRIYAHAEVNFTMSQHVARSLIEQYDCPPARVKCVYAGSNTPVHPEATNPDRYRRKRILFNGLFWDRKGGPDLLAAFLIVLQRHPDARLIILGCHPPIDLPNCEVLGWRPLAEVPRCYADASVFCLPTRNEPFGIVIVEAMMHKLPIVSTTIGAVPDMVENATNGYLIRPGDVNALAEALIKLLDSPETCARFGEASLIRARERFTWEAAGGRMAEGIRAALSARRRASIG